MNSFYENGLLAISKLTCYCTFNEHKENGQKVSGVIPCFLDLGNEWNDMKNW